MTKALISALLLLAIALLVAHLEHRFAPVEEAIRSDAPISQLRACDFTISDRLHYGDEPSPRCYFRRDSK
jgi:hypothetical protein